MADVYVEVWKLGFSKVGDAVLRVHPKRRRQPYSFFVRAGNAKFLARSTEHYTNEQDAITAAEYVVGGVLVPMMEVHNRPGVSKYSVARVTT